VAPDLFNGDKVPTDLNDPSFNTTAFLAAHGPEAVDPIVGKAIAYLRAAGVDKVAATGYCYGGRYAFRAVAEGKGADAAFAAHPSLLGDDEILAITKPASVAAAGEHSSLLSG
jgi:dienelactone hydrolase